MSEAVKARVACGGSTGVSDHADAVSSSGPLHQACRLLRLEGAEELQDLIASLILSECVYKKLELDEAGVAAKVTEFVSGFPPGWVQLQAVQLSLSGIPQHYLIATSPTSMYVAFMGTKQFQDILADANLLHTPVWAESARLAADRQSIPAAHRGFLERARAIHVEQLYELAVSRGLRLVLCGHSLGGAVAKLCTLRLLRELPDWPRPRVRCIAFATPAVGNAALAELVESAGWAGHFSTYYLPEDQLVRLISFSQARTSSSSSGGGNGGGGAAVAGGGKGGNTSGNGGGRVRAERRRRAKERAAQRGGIDRPAAVGGEGERAAMAPALLAAAAEAAATSAAGLAAAARLDEATLGRLGAGDAAAATAAAATAAAMAPHPSFRLPRPPSVSSISSASSCASVVTCSTTPGAGSVSSSNSSRSLCRNGSFGDASSGDAGATLERRDSRIAHTRGAPERPSSDGDLSLCTLPPPSHRPNPGPGAEASSSFAESLDEDQAGVVLAMEEILAPGPDALEAAAAAGVALSGQPPADLAAAQREALYGNAGGSWGLRLALGRKRVLRRLRRLAARARIPLPKALLPVSRYHTFGEQWFVTDEGALSPEELEVALRQQKAQDQPQQPQQHVQPQQHQLGAAVTVAAAAATAVGPAAAAAAAAAPEGTRGFFSFHRMVAYRQRHADLLARLVRSAAGGERQEPSPAALVLQPQQAMSISGGAVTAAASTVAVSALYNSVHVSDSLLPRISVQHAVLRGVLPEDPAGSRANLDAASRNRTRLEPRSGAAAATVYSGDDGAAVGSAGADAAAAAGRPATGVAPVVSHLLSWVWGGGSGGMYRSGSGGGGGRPGGPEDTVQLDLELDGHNLQYCRKVCVTLVRDGAEVAAGATAAAAGVTATAPTGSASSPAAASVAAAADRGAGAAVATARVAPAPASGRTARWVPFVIARGGDGTAGTAAANATPAQQPQRETTTTAATAAGHASSSPLPSLSSSSPSPPGPALAAAAVAAAAPGPAFATEVPCEVVQVLYAQPYSDEANPPPLHPVSLFRNSLHHFAGNLISRCRLRGQGVGPGSLASLAAAGAASASASPEALAGGGALAGRNGGYGGPWRRFRFQHSHRPTVNGGTNGSDSSSSSTTSSNTAVSAISPNAKNEGSNVAFDLRQFPGVFLPGCAGSSGSAAGDGAAAAAATMAAHAIVEMPSRLLLRVTLPRSVARGLLDGTLPGRLVVSARSDFHELPAVSVAVQRPRVAIIGTSPYAASLVQAVLSAPAALAAASLDGRAAAAGGGSAAAAAAGVAAWVPPPVAWALAAVRGATATATVRRRAADAAADTAASASGQNADAVQVSGSGANSRLAAQATGGAGDATGTTAAASTALPQRTGGRLAPWLTQIAPQTGMPRLRARMGKLRWGIRQSLAAAAVGVAAASAAGATSAAAAVGAAAVVASTVAAFSSDGGASVLANAAVTVAAVVAAAAAAATAFSGSEATVLVVAAASAAAMAVAAATSSGEGIISPPPVQQQQQQAPSAVATGVLSSASLPAPLAAPLPGVTQAQAKPAITPAAVPQASPRWVLRFGARPAGVQASARTAQARGGGRAAVATVSAARSDASGVSRPVGRGWALWWAGRTPPLRDDGAPAGGRPAAVAAAPSAQRWLSWPLPAAARQVRGSLASSRTQTPTTAALAATDLGLAAAAASAQHGRPVMPVVAAAAAATAPSSAKLTTPLSPVISAEPRWRPSGWFQPLGAAQRQLVTAVADTTAAAAAGRRAAGASPAVAAAVSLTQLRAQLLGSLRAGSGRAALPLPPGVLSDGLELCNVMVEPLRRTWGSGRAGAAAAAAGQHLLPRRSGRGGTPPAAVAAAAPLASVPAAMLWKGRCLGPSERLDAATTSPPSAAHSAPAPALAAGLAVPGIVSPRAAAEAARAAWDGAAAAAAAAVLGVMPARDGCPELVGVAPFAAVRRMEEGLRRQVLQRGIWWRALLGALFRPVALVGMLGRLPGWGIMQVLRRGHLTQGDGSAPLAQAGAASSGASAAADATVDTHGAAAASASGAERQPSDWGALLVVASCRDPLRVLRGRDMESLRSRAADAGCPLVPVLLTCAESPPARRAAAARALATACGVAPGEVRALVLEAALLHQPAAAIPRADLAAVWRGTVDCEGAAELRSAVRQAVAAAAQAERQEPPQQQHSPLLGAQW